MQPPPLDRRASSVKWQREMKELRRGDCGEAKRGREESGVVQVEGGDCRRKDGSRALRKSSLERRR